MHSIHKADASRLIYSHHQDRLKVHHFANSVLYGTRMSLVKTVLKDFVEAYEAEIVALIDDESLPEEVRVDIGSIATSVTSLLTVLAAVKEMPLDAIARLNPGDLQRAVLNVVDFL